MKRREFLKRAAPAVALPLCIDGFRLAAHAHPPLVAGMAGTSAALDRVLVVVQMSGGNDGLNTIIPMDQYQTYLNLRQNIAIAQSRALPLTAATGLHPAMTGMKSLYDAGKLCVVQGVSYPNPNFSHFRATDIWLTASDYNQDLSSGWMGRYLDYEFQGYPDGYPNDFMPDPLAIQIGSVVSVGFQGATRSTAITITDPNTFYQLVSGSSSGGQDKTPNTTAGQELAFIRQVAAQSIGYATRIKSAADRAQNKSTLYPAAGQNSLADQFKIVARLIAGGLRTRIYYVNLGGFDTHSSQVVATDTSTGTHANLLSKLSVAIQVFLNDLELLECDHRVVGMTFSEFGRRPASNASLGTDHGTAAPVFVFGRMVKGGVIGSNPNLSSLSGGNLLVQIDFRTLYAAVVGRWFGADQVERDAAMLKAFTPLDIIQSPVMLPRRRPLVAG